MSNCQDQSLDEDVVFLPVTESSPEFLHCEDERRSMERLLNAGPEAFYGSIDTERSRCFLSSEEVGQITSWAQRCSFKWLQTQRQAHGEVDCSEVEDRSTYFPSKSDTPTPDLELGWPEASPRETKERITVYTSPPAEGEPSVREVIRRNLQKARKVIAIVTDRLTDGAMIGDLHNAASRGVPVYIILNQRSIEENFTLYRLKHPNMQVRALGGKIFCARSGRMVVGEMKEKFLLVDLETVIHGSYSLTWTDAHLHRQLITVLRGSVVDSFDREFRVLFAASLPVPDTWRVAGTHVCVDHQLKELSNLSFKEHLPMEPDITSPQPPPAHYLLDWEAMGVVRGDQQIPDSPQVEPEKIVDIEVPQQSNIPFDKRTPIKDIFTYNGHHFVDERRLKENISPVTNNVCNNSTTFNYIEPSSTDLTPERMKRVECIVEKTRSRQLSTEKGTNLQDRPTRLNDEPTETTRNMAIDPLTKRGEHPSREPELDKKHNIDETMPYLENTPTTRKPLILKVPQSESFSSLSDIMKKFQTQQSSSGLLKRGPSTAVPVLSQSMMDLSTHSANANDVPVPRFKANLDQMMSTFSLMKKRNEDLKQQLYRTTKTLMPTERPRNSRYGLDWRMSLVEMEEDQQTETMK